MEDHATQSTKAGYFNSGETKTMAHRPELESASYQPAGKLQGKVCLLTGADSGIGAAAAIAFAKEGAKAVAILYHSSKEDAAVTAARIAELGSEAHTYQGDVGDPAFAAKVAQDLAGKHGHIDVLVNNAGEQHPVESILEVSDAQLDRTFRTNIFGMFYFVKAVLPHMPKGGCVINTTSLTAYQGNDQLLDYASTKGAIVAFTRSLAINQDFLQRGLRVNAVAPGPIWTPLIPASFGEGQEAHFGKDTALGRPGQPYELAPAYVYLACEDSSYMTGQTLHLNGGMIVNG